MNYLWLMGGGLLVFGLIFLATGLRAGPGYGSEILVGIGGFSAAMGGILVFIAVYHRDKTSNIANSQE